MHRSSATGKDGINPGPSQRGSGSSQESGSAAVNPPTLHRNKGCSPWQIAAHQDLFDFAPSLGTFKPMIQAAGAVFKACVRERLSGVCPTHPIFPD